jgi:adenine-specific DNA methylase
VVGAAAIGSGAGGDLCADGGRPFGASCQFPTEEAQERERQRLFRLIEELVQWENTTNETVLAQARDEIWKSWRTTCAENKDHPRAAELFNPDKLPAFHDPFAGGGSLPLEAQRLGLEAYASDLNPVAVLINKAMIEIPPKFAGKPPIHPPSPSMGLPLPTSLSLTLSMRKERNFWRATQGNRKVPYPPLMKIL